MLYVVYIESIRAITIWDKKPDGDNLFEHLNCFRNEPLIYHIHPGEDNYDEWLDFFFPASKYGECLDSNIMRTISQEAFGCLETVFKDGKLLKDYTLAEIRERIDSGL